MNQNKYNLKHIYSFLLTKYLILLSKIRIYCRIIKLKNKQMPDKNITILSQNCIGGCVYHDFGMKFNSPTINLFFNHNDFIKFCKNLNYYISLEIEEFKEKNYSFPIGLLGDIKLYFVHYKSFEEAKEKWEDRKRRIDYKNIYIVCTDQDINKNEDYINDFLNLPYKNKIMFSHLTYDNKNICVIPGFEKSNEVLMMTDYCSWFGKKYYDYFDFYKWLS